MSVEEQPEDVKEEITEEVVDEEDAFTEALLQGLGIGEDEVEEPENSEQPEVVAEAEENQVSEDAEPEPLVAEGQEESTLPEWATDLDVTDPEVADAVEYFAGGEKADWTRQRHDAMTEEQVEKLKNAQRAQNKWQSSQNQPVDTEAERRAQLEKEAYDRLDEMLHGKKEEVKEEVPVPVDIQAKVREMIENGDTEAAYEAMVDGFKEEQERKLAEMQKAIVSQIDEKLDARLSKTKTKSYWSSFDKYGMELRDKDPRFAQMLVNDASGKNALLRILEMGSNPITGEVIYEGNDPHEDLSRAYDYFLELSRGGKRQVPRPATSAQPPVGSASGDTPEISESDFDLSWDEFFAKHPI